MSRENDATLRVRESALDGVLLLEPAVYRDHRGTFRELLSRDKFEKVTGIRRQWAQVNHSRSHRGVLRGIHYQMNPPQGKLVSCIDGEIFDVAVDLRRSSPTFGSWVGFTLSEANGHQLWIPEGFGHGFLALSGNADVVYETSTAYRPSSDRSLAWNDPDVGIDWPLTEEPELADKDRMAPRLSEAETYQ